MAALRKLGVIGLLALGFGWLLGCYLFVAAWLIYIFRPGH